MQSIDESVLRNRFSILYSLLRQIKSLILDALYELLFPILYILAYGALLDDNAYVQ